MTYQRVLLKAFGGPEQLELQTVEALPEPGPGEIRVKVLTAGTVLVLAPSVFPPLSAQERAEAEVGKGPDVGVDDEDNVAAFAAVAPVGAAAVDILLPPEAHTATASVAGLDGNLYFIDEHDGRAS